MTSAKRAVSLQPLPLISEERGLLGWEGGRQDRQEAEMGGDWRGEDEGVGKEAELILVQRQGKGLHTSLGREAIDCLNR